MRAATWAAIVLCTATSASANTSSHSGSGSSDGACIRWEPILLDMAGADMAGADMSKPDLGGAPLDLGPAPPDLGDPHAGMRCVERAGLFNCSFAPSGGDASGGAVALVFATLLLVRARRWRDD